MKRFKLTTFSKVLIFIVIAAIAVGGFLFVRGKVADKTVAVVETKEVAVQSSVETKEATTDTVTTSDGEDNEINLSLDEWIG